MAEAGDSAREQHVIIPGVEHKFFEEELDKMEHHSSSADSIVVLAVDNSPHSEFAFSCEYSPADRRSDCCLLIVDILCQSAAARLYCLFAGGSALPVVVLLKRPLRFRASCLCFACGTRWLCLCVCAFECVCVCVCVCPSVCVSMSVCV